MPSLWSPYHSPFLDVLKVAMADDLILFVKALPFLMFPLIIILILFAVWFKKAKIEARINYNG